ncbi:MAG: Tfp pilus assembly protein PilF [Porticoccus sp.]|jgi:Tfp pilus assembly protein PilF
MKAGLQYVVICTLSFFLVAACTPVTSSGGRPPSSDQAITPNSPITDPASKNAVIKLLEDAWRYNRERQHDRSNTVAERAMRINHSEAEIYLVMASNYFSLGQFSLAEQVASRGLPLASDNKLTKKNLNQLLVLVRAKIIQE